jgi:hypothetical protein
MPWKHELREALWALDGVQQDPRYHPEGDALTHSLQVFEKARLARPRPALLAAALLHDVGKALSTPDHAALGADLLGGLVADEVVWLVRHHMDLHHKPRATRAALWGTPQLAELETLRRWDLAGRVRGARHPSVEEALDALEAVWSALRPDAPPALVAAPDARRGHPNLLPTTPRRWARTNDGGER